MSSSGISFSGLGSGIDTNSIVTQLMALEARPKQILQQQRSKLTVADGAFNSVKSKLNALKTAVQSLGQSTDWNAVKATSSDDTRLSVSASASSSQGSYQFTVVQLASRHTQATFFNVADRGTTNITNGATSITVSTSAGSASVAVGTGTLDEVVSAINAQSTAKVRASAIQVSPGQWKLQMEATDPTETVTTSASQFSLGPLGTVSNGQSAIVRVGTAPGFDVTSNSNTFTDIIPGVTITAKAVSAIPVAVELSTDQDALAAKVKGFVDAYNSAQGEMANQSKYDQTTKVASPLFGQASVRGALTAIADTVIGDTTTNLGQLGMSVDKAGALSFDKAKFTSTYNADPAAAKAMFTDPVTGVAKRLIDRVDALVNATDGIVTSGQTTVQRQVKDLDTRISAFDVRLTQREASLRRQFTAMDTAVARMRNSFQQFSSRLGG
jgi:flagellar hook-associated protein 2